MCNIDIKYNYFCKDTLFQMEYNIYVFAKQTLLALQYLLIITNLIDYCAIFKSINENRSTVIFFQNLIRIFEPARNELYNGYFQGNLREPFKARAP